MITTKKKIKFTNRTEELSVKEVIEKFQALLHKITRTLGTYAEKKYYKHTYAFSYEDLYQNASIGLIKAYENYDESKDTAFMTYAFPMVKGEVLRYVRDAALARRAGPSTYDFKDVNLDGEYDHSHNGDSNVKISDIIPDSNNDIDNFLNKNEIDEYLSLLTDEERQIINLLYFQGKTQVEIGKMLGTSQVQVSRKITKSLKKIRDHIKRSEEKPMVRKDAIIPSSSTNIKEPVKKQNDITFNENTTLSFMPKEVVQAPLLGNHEEIILTPTPEPIPKIQKSAFKNAFADTNVKSMLVELDRSCQAIFENYRVEFSDMVGSFTREDLIKRKKNIEKAIEIFDYIYNS